MMYKKVYLLLVVGFFFSCGSSTCFTNRVSSVDSAPGKRSKVRQTIGRIDSASEGDLTSTQRDSITLIIQYDTEVGSATLLEAVKHFPAKLLHQYKVIPSIAIGVHASQEEKAKKYFEKVQGVLSVERSEKSQLHK